MNEIINRLDFNKMNGIIPVITMDENGKILMLAFMNKEALERTLKTGRMHYWSRSRGKIWMKGEESGHYQHVLGIYTDCDRDSLLFIVRQEGKVCHEGENTCFHEPIIEYKIKPLIIEELERIIEERIKEPKQGSYTSSVVSKGLEEASKKVIEEAAEVAIAALKESEEKLISEFADLIFHLLILLKMKGLNINYVYEELWKRRK
ncbi:MAG: bifunctional phosphoribosyl-AMP cyclohydrolase/phosphoribosyl-ATP diphosphatase HisIE [Candidatus Methanomethyliaceae archaeon]|nr:bifunctional phosphoribosyl-AMP cyclohydrolase/phosphoribosyl-ATP diphosphatase HisIE [Candidatus Methanomethyliaceae archaeon]MDW7970763.1 bifunctional phosphoribosyl-AMP cyclohydrolase/phosphoribosyl-ATP diphosphatase HisIE [Nitrososphaerota archaeon]